jgi:hypothetical protein
MELIPEAIVEKTWQEVAGFSPAKVKREMMKIVNTQPELLTFVEEFTKEWKREVGELAIYMFVVVYRMFQETQGRIQRISLQEIMECYEHNEGLMDRLVGINEKFLDRIATIQGAKQPYVVKYVADTIMEEQEGEDAVTFTDEERGLLFLLVKTVVDVLDRRGMKA